MTGTQKVLLNVEGALATVVLNRPEVMNAFDKELWYEVARAAHSIQRNPAIRVAILTGAGERAFSAGLDIKAVAAGWKVLEDLPARPGHESMAHLKDAFTAYENLAVPVIAAINGFCLGAGLELALCCDMRLASDTASFSLPEVQLGAIPDMGSTQRLPRIVGGSKAKELIFTSRRIDAAEALAIGLVNRVYAKDRLMPEARKLAEEIASREPAIVQGAKRAINAAVNHGLEAGLNLETALALAARGAEGIARGSAAFLKERESKKA